MVSDLITLKVCSHFPGFAMTGDVELVLRTNIVLKFEVRIYRSHCRVPLAWMIGAGFESK